MDTSMQDESLVKALFPDFYVPQKGLSDEDWASLAIAWHAELKTFPMGDYPRLASLRQLLIYQANRYAGNKAYDARVESDEIDDTRCATKIRGMVFAHCHHIGRCSSRSDWKNFMHEDEVTRGSRSIHLLLGAQGFYLALVHWYPEVKWGPEDRDGRLNVHEALFKGKVTLIEADHAKLLWFFKKVRASGVKWPPGILGIKTIIQVQHWAVKSAHSCYKDARALANRIENAIAPLRNLGSAIID
jgi:hypothetical protein